MISRGADAAVNIIQINYVSQPSFAQIIQHQSRVSLTVQEGWSVDRLPQSQQTKPRGLSFTSEWHREHFKSTHTFFTNISLPTTVHKARLSMRVAYKRDKSVRGDGVINSMKRTTGEVNGGK